MIGRMHCFGAHFPDIPHPEKGCQPANTARMGDPTYMTQNDPHDGIGYVEYVEYVEHVRYVGYVAVIILRYPPPLPLRRHAERQKNDRQTGSPCSAIIRRWPSAPVSHRQEITVRCLSKAAESQPLFVQTRRSRTNRSSKAAKPPTCVRAHPVHLLPCPIG